MYLTKSTTRWVCLVKNVCLRLAELRIKLLKFYLIFCNTRHWQMKRGQIYFTWGDNFYRNAVNMTQICLIFWYVSTNVLSILHWISKWFFSFLAVLKEHILNHASKMSPKEAKRIVPESCFLLIFALFLLRQPALKSGTISASFKMNFSNIYMMYFTIS